MTESLVYPAQDDAAMLAAYADARATFKFFWRELSWEYRRIVPALSLAAIKLPFATDASAIGAPSHEHMWVSDVQFDGDQLSGNLLNDPAWISGLTAGDAVSAPIGELEDWMYVSDGLAYGGHTIDAMRRTMSQDERAEHDAAWGLDFGGPGAVRLVPARGQERRGGLFGKMFGSRPAQPIAAEQDPSECEHPMSENMAAKFDQGLRDQPDMAHFRDDAGWTLLQRDALAGNYQPVWLLLKYGADASLRTPSGKTALDLARQMQWPRIVQLLEDHS
ncbi:DUF2314 domain-containing protein [Xanthomonas vesicatoria]|uniref:DUF2314 domain-containing protein n=1 Tax=Xanthomonas vesicatoria TaxID=56460 RepID=UPI001E534F0A|nr:DUF2314 domain-containing protein [Xanthomonas vesicatoria]MCC8617353.1 DUF2314 domain-containing protein [Xanthomonas vesicatoria]MCC8629475.1 DUF2314 domain-containing protein [Xanthomonas vesicatoria]